MNQIGIGLSWMFFLLSPVAADDWGCQVLLCMSDPRGPTTEKECIPPMRKLWRHLAKGGSFPTCDLANDRPTDINAYLQQPPRIKE